MQKFGYMVIDRAGRYWNLLSQYVEKPTSYAQDNYLEKCNKIIQSVLPPEGLKLQAAIHYIAIAIQGL